MDGLDGEGGAVRYWHALLRVRGMAPWRGEERRLGSGRIWCRIVNHLTLQAWWTLRLSAHARDGPNSTGWCHRASHAGTGVWLLILL